MLETFLKDLWTAISAASPIAAMFCFVFMIKAWRDEARNREERIAVQKSKEDLHERTLNGLSVTTASVDKLAVIIEALTQSVRERYREPRG